MAAASITALLGPTNTGKTHRAIERMLEHETGMIGLPLRLLAREVYDRVSARLGEGPVALVTGEEKRVPPRARYWVCTVEAMPREREVDFLAVDEIQLAAHPQRGHVFSDRLLHARGRLETWFLGADTMRPLMAELVPTARVLENPRLSRLSATGSSSLGALPPRSAVVVFSMPRVYELAERIRSRRGGAAVVLGALSPRARNAQVAMFQSGEVDYMVATDAIGMGLNLDLNHVAFADLSKYDGRETRPLDAPELAQIAGRAGRHLNDGSFGTLSPLPALPERLAADIEAHRFAPLRQVVWRSSDLDTSSLDALIASLRRPPPRACLRPIERTDDMQALCRLAERAEIRRRARTPDEVALLWEVCQIPDYRQLLLDHHASLVGELFVALADRGRLDPDFVALQLRRTEDASGDIDTLLMRLESVRTWTYVTSHPRWLQDAAHFHGRARAIEDRLSDALHQALVERFVDRSKKRRARTTGSAGHPFQQLEALMERMCDEEPGETDIERLLDAPHGAFRADACGRILHAARPVGMLTRGSDLLRPEVRVTLEDVGSGARSRIQRRLVAWSRDLVAELLAPLSAPALDDLSPAARGLIYQLEMQLGTVLVSDARAQLEACTAADRDRLAAAGVVLGRRVAYVRELLHPRALAVRAALCSAQLGPMRGLPAPGAVSVRPPAGLSASTCAALGYPLFGPRAVRADVVERIAAAYGAGSAPPELGRIASWLGCSKSEARAVLGALDPERPATRRPRRRRRRRAAGARQA